ncbi:MAG: lamin tail domain-containing protein [bacterium]|nr:lamin tail domain-containing protein [bacterium]
MSTKRFSFTRTVLAFLAVMFASFTVLACQTTVTTAPTTAAPTTVAPTTVAPTTAAPTTVAPTTVAPTTVAPTTVAPTTVAPTTVAPTTTVNTDQATLDAAKTALAIIFASGDSASAVTQNVTLPIAAGSVTISWASSNPSLVTVAGVVTRPATDTVVTLTASLSLNAASGSKTFNITIKAVEEEPVDPLDALDAIEITGTTLTFNTANSRYSTSSDIVLPATSMGLDIVWSLPANGFLTNAGVVTRPAYGQPDSTLILTATIDEEIREFIVIVLAVTVKPVSLILSEAKDSLLLAGVGNGVAANLTLPATVGTEGVTVTWASNLPDVLSGAGVVARQLDNTTVILTATLSLSGQEVTKEFEVVVLASTPYTVVADIAEAITLATESYVRINGVTVVGLTTDGYMIADASGALFVFLNMVPSASVVVGQVYDIYGMIDFYFSPWQINAIKDATKPTILIPSEAPATVLVPVEKTSVTDLIAGLGTTFTPENPLEYTYIRLTAKVRVQSADNYATLLVDQDYAGGNIDTAANSAFKPNALVVYYKSNKAALTPFNGLVVTLDVFIYSLRTDRNVFTVLYTGGVDNIQTSLDDQGIINVVKSGLVAGFQSEYPEVATVSLPSSILGTSIAWASESTYINLATGALTMPASGQETVTLTATLTRGLVTDTQVITFKVGELPVMTAQQINDAPLNSIIRFQGVVIGFSLSAQFGNTLVYIQAPSGGLYLFRLQAVHTPAIVIGNTLDVVGLKGNFNGLVQIGANNVSKLTVLETGVVITPTQITAESNLESLKSTLVTVSGYLKQKYTLSGTGTLYFEFINEFGTFKGMIMGLSDSSEAVRNPILAAINAAEVGAMVTFTGPMSWNTAQGGALLHVFNAQSLVFGPAPSAEVLTNIALGLLTLPVENAEVTANLTLPTVAAFGRTIVWSSSNPAIVSNTGVVTRPSFNGANTLVTLSYTVKLGEVDLTTASIVVNVLKKAELSEEEKLSADADALAVATTLTGVQTLTLPVVGSNGSTIVWSSNNVLVDAATGEVSMPAVRTSELVTLTALVSLGALTPVEKTFVIRVGYATDLFISYYMEGFPGNRKVIVIHNNTGETVDLAAYKLGSFNNPASAPTASTAMSASPAALSGMLAHGKSFILYHGDMVNSSNTAYILEFATTIANLPVGNLSLAHAMQFNGERGDIIALVKTVESVAVFVDYLGEFNGSIASGAAPWETLYTRDMTLVRNANIVGPTAVVDWTQWSTLPANTFDERLVTWR